MKKTLSFVALFGATFLYAETSAFDAGNINNSDYGLTQNEKILKDRLDNLNRQYSQVSSRLSTADEKIDGLQSLVEGLNAQYSKTNSRLNNAESIEQNLTKELNELKAYVRESRRIQEANNKQIKKALNEFSELLDAYLGKTDSNLSKPVLTQIPEFSESNQSKEKPKSTAKPKDESWKKMDPDDLLELAMKEFKSKDASVLDRAKDKFEYLISKNYKPAASNFYLGEIEYKQKRYANAIGYYKKSAMIYSKAKYMPELLYHTAISLDKVGNTKEANGFYRALKAEYPNTPQAKAAPNRK
ncbi:hypothetical protein DMB92_07590 [Campylobacter sp. MIT 99-7217]|uniref:tetratricopeptide repeat protein n=1 Tax=Campylobacter sp. MIT 99-7217 TaxID=535091 RepID=UPI00115B862E|nr:hypothetical protein [Campylobacter sp. MIT 99-7217]TQR30316.1 hypothetical protein DMB92_07590 [Campylobacter sp. MIT 99-7217]